jgi:TctA family transporter
MVWVIVLSNIIAVTICFLFLQQLANLTYVKGTLLVPFLLVLLALGAFTAHNSFADILVMLLFGAIGVAAIRWNWPRPPLLLAMVLGDTAERYLFLSYTLFGWAWLLRPLVIAFAVLTLLGVFWPFLRERWSGRSGPGSSGSAGTPLDAARAG